MERYAGQTATEDAIDAKARFKTQHQAGVKSDLAEYIRSHPVLGRLPKRDQANAAMSAARNLFIALSSASIVKIGYLDRVATVAPIDRPSDAYEVDGWHEHDGQFWIRAHKNRLGQRIGLDLPEDELIVVSVGE
jgi:hypothetical protein